MAVNRRSWRPFATGIGLRPGTGGLLLLRLLVLVVFGAIAASVSTSGIAGKQGTNPDVLAHAAAPPPRVAFGILGEPPPAFLAVAVGAILLFFVLDQLLTAAALRRFDPRELEPPVGRPWRIMWNEGAPVFWRFVRVTILGHVLIVIGAVAVGAGFIPIYRMGYAQGWTGLTRFIVVPFLQGALGTIWAMLIGVFTLWCRVLIVADGRWRVRRVALHVVRLLWRAPIRTGVVFLAVALVLQVAGAVLLVVFRPGIAPGPLYAPWLLLVIVSVCVWHWRLHAARALYGQALFDVVRQGSDEPFGWIQRLWRRLRKAESVERREGAPAVQEPSSI